MPLYDYHCPDCGHRFEEFRPMAERDHAPCPKCGKEADKQLSGFFSPRSTSSSSTPPPCGGGGLPGG